MECPGLKAEDGCQGADFCVTKYVWQRINDSIAKTVNEINLQQLVKESRETRKKSGYTAIKCEN